MIENNIFANYSNPVIDFTRNLKENGDLARFWLSFKDRARLMLNPIAATRLGNLYLFLETLKDIISYTSAYSNIKYSRNLTVMLCEILSLKIKYPEVYQQFVVR